MFNQFFRNRVDQNLGERSRGADRRRVYGRGAGGTGRGQGGAGRGQGGAGRGQGGGNKPGSGPSGNCVCPKCGHKEPHVVAQRCIDRNCPKCGTKMIRE